MTLLHVFHRSIAAAVQRIDSEILRILGTILIPEEVLPSIAGVPEGDWLNFMWMVKAGAIRMADAGRGIELVEARRGTKKTCCVLESSAKGTFGHIPSIL